MAEVNCYEKYLDKAKSFQYLQEIRSHAAGLVSKKRRKAPLDST